MERLSFANKRIMLIFAGLFTLGMVTCMIPVSVLKLHHLSAFKLKTSLHDNIGQNILIAKRYLYAPDSVDKKRMLEFWKDNVRHLVNDEPEEWELPYYVISKEADLLGIRLNIIGELPRERD